MNIPSRVFVSGPLAAFREGFLQSLLEQGYTPDSAANQLQLIAHLNRWLLGTRARQRFCRWCANTTAERGGAFWATEHLEAEQGHSVHAETLRQWMLAAGLGNGVRQTVPAKARAEAALCELVQLDVNLVIPSPARRRCS